MLFFAVSVDPFDEFVADIRHSSRDFLLQGSRLEPAGAFVDWSDAFGGTGREHNDKAGGQGHG